MPSSRFLAQVFAAVPLAATNRRHGKSIAVVEEGSAVAQEAVADDSAEASSNAVAGRRATNPAVAGIRASCHASQHKAALASSRQSSQQQETQKAWTGTREHFAFDAYDIV